MLTFSCAAIFNTNGLKKFAFALLPVFAAGAAAGAAACGAGVAGAGVGAGAGAGAAAGAGEAATAPLAVSILAITVPTGTTSSTLNKISFNTPSPVLGTSLSTLSVAISNKVSSIFTLSPTLLHHFKMVASMMLSPILGITMSIIAIVSIIFIDPKSKELKAEYLL
jgi:hypothetical protein